MSDKSLEDFLNGLDNTQEYNLSEEEIQLFEGFVGSMINKIQDASTFVKSVKTNKGSTVGATVDKGLDAITARRGQAQLTKIKNSAKKLVSGLADIDSSLVDVLKKNQVIADAFGEAIVNLILSVKVSPNGKLLNNINKVLAEKIKLLGAVRP
jgi:hypothetical protein